MKKTTVNCKYANCLHEDRELNKEEAIRVGNFYYHKDCYQTKEDIKKIIQLFKDFINPNPVYAKLQNVINTILFKKNLSSEFLLFGLQYYIRNKIPLNYPQGLYYVIQNKNVIDSYNKQNIKKEKYKVEIKDETESTFEHKKGQPQGFADIIK